MNFINWDNGDYCNNCKTNSLKLVTSKGTIINVEAGKDNTNISIDSMKCENCGKEFMINWSGKLPRPLDSNFKLKVFMNNFSK